MAIKLGVSKHARKEILEGSGTSSDDWVSISQIGEHIHRVLTGGEPVFNIFYPSISIDEDNGELITVWKAIRKPLNKTTILDVLAKKDASIKARKTMNKDARSRLSGTKRWVYAIFDRSLDEVAVKLVGYPYTIAKDLSTLEQKLDINNSKFLRYGPTFTWDAIITHVFDERKQGPDFSKHSYTVEVGKAEWAGKIPSEILDYENPIEALSEESLKKIFTEEELAAIESSEIDLDEVIKPNTDEEIKEMLTEFPLNPYALDKNGNPIFADPELLIKEIKTLGLALPDADSGDLEFPPLEEKTETPSYIPDKAKEVFVPDESEKKKITFLE